MFRTIRPFIIAGIAALTLGFGSTAHGLTSSTVLTGFTSDSGPVELLVSLDDMGGSGKVQFTLQTLINTADITGFYFHISDESLIGGLSVVTPNTYVTAIAKGANNINQVGGSYNKLNGGGANNPGKFDVGLAIGTQGASPNFYPTASFVLQHSSEALTLSNFADQWMGAHIQSIGQTCKSAKLKGQGGTPTPEPMTAMLTLLSAAAVSIAVRRRRSA